MIDFVYCSFTFNFTPNIYYFLSSTIFNCLFFLNTLWCIIKLFICTCYLLGCLIWAFMAINFPLNVLTASWRLYNMCFYYHLSLGIFLSCWCLGWHSVHSKVCCLVAMHFWRLSYCWFLDISFHVYWVSRSNSFSPSPSLASSLTLSLPSSLSLCICWDLTYVL